MENHPSAMPAASIRLSQSLLLGIRKREEVGTLLENLARFPETQLLEELSEEPPKLAFWINCYNSFIQLRLLAQGEAPSTGGGFFTKRDLLIAGRRLSFDDIEHGILRGGRAKYGFGWLPSLWLSPFVRKHKVQKPDWRIHFALNCGAKSCPPIAFYTPEGLTQALEIATRSYLLSDTSYNPDSNTLQVSRLFFWFHGDFGGHSGIRRIMRQHGIIGQDQRPKLHFKTYDWRIDLNNYVA